MRSDEPIEALPVGELRIGSFRVEPRLFRISGPGGPRKLRPKEMRVLCCLADHAPEPLSSQQLREAVWGDQAVVDTIVANTIYELRKALDEVADDAGADLIETLPGGGGYRLAVPVRQGVPGQPPPEHRLRPGARVAGLLAGTALVVVTSAAVIVTRSCNEPPPSETLKVAMVAASGAKSGTKAILFSLVEALGGSKDFDVVPAERPHDCRIEVDAERRGDEVHVSAIAASTAGDARLDIEGKYDDVLRELRLKLASYRKTSAPSVDAWIQYLIARDHFDKGSYDKAISVLRIVTEEHTYPHANALLAQIYNVSGNQSQALKEIERAIELGAEMKERDRLVFLRRKAQIEGDLEAEFDFLKNLHRIDPLEPEWNYYLGWYYSAHHRDCDKSRKRLTDAVENADPPVARYYQYLADVLLCCGHVEEALENAHEFADLQADSGAHNFLALVYLTIGRYEQARQEVDRLRAQDPGFDPPVLTLGLLRFARGSYSEALEAFNEYRARMESNAGEAEAHWNMARIHLATKRWDEAIEHAERALRLKPNAAPALWIRGRAELQKGRLDLARESARRIRALRDREFSRYDMEYFHHLRGRIALAEGKPEKAIEEFRQAVDLHPLEHAFFRDALARAYVAGGDLQEAVEAYRAALELNPSYGPSLCGLAEVYELQGFRADAEELYERCLTVFGEDNEEEPLAARARARLAVLR